MFRKFAVMLVPAALAVLGLSASSARGQFDVISVAKSAASRGRITEMGRDKVVLDMSGVSREFQVNEILRIAYADEPNELSNARAAVLQRNYNAALTELRKLDAAPPGRDVIKQDVDFYKALSLARLAMTEGGDKGAATNAMLGFARSAPQNYHFYEAAEVMGDLALSAGNYADAVKYYGPISAAPWGDYQMRANNAIGRALSADKQFEPALAKFDAVLASELATPEAAHQKLLATVGKSICLAETGKAEAGIAALQDIIAKNDPQESALFARTYNALGRCYLKQSKPKDALLAFLHTDVLFYSDPEAHAEALFYLSTLWNDVNKSDRAVAARSTLQQRYAGSVWNNPNRKP
jgi:tetratricopeptide (TPR) repeat protein